MSGLLEVAVLDRQRKNVVDVTALRDLLQRVWGIHPAASADGDHSLTVCLVSDRRIRVLNHEYRDRNSATDVLSFCDGESDPDGLVTHLGDIVVSVETARRQAAEREIACGQELQILVLHGYLHLLGYDHENDDGEMMCLQAELERELTGVTGSRKMG